MTDVTFHDLTAPLDDDVGSLPRHDDADAGEDDDLKQEDVW